MRRLAHDPIEDRKRNLRRLLQTLLGLAIAAAGVVAFLKHPDHEGVPLLLTSVGCGMVEPSLVKRIFTK